MSVLNLGFHINAAEHSLRIVPDGVDASLESEEDRTVIDGALFAPSFTIDNVDFGSIQELLESRRRCPEMMREYVEDLRILGDENLLNGGGFLVSEGGMDREGTWISLVPDDPLLDELIDRVRAGDPPAELKATFAEPIRRFKDGFAESMIVSWWGYLLQDLASDGRVVALSAQPSRSVMSALSDSQSSVGTTFGSEWLGARLLLNAVPGLLDLRAPDLLTLRDDLSAPIARFRSAISKMTRDPNPVMSDQDLTRHWVEAVQPELEEITELLRQQSLLRRLVMDVDSSDILAMSAGVYLAASTPSDVLQAVALALPLALRVARSQGIGRPGRNFRPRGRIFFFIN